MVIGKGYITIAVVNDGAQGPQGPQGEPGNDGVDGLTVSATPSAIVLPVKKTGDTTFVADLSGGATARLMVYRGSAAINTRCTYSVRTATNCTATVSSSGTVTVTGVTQQTVDGLTLPCSEGSVTVTVTAPDRSVCFATVAVRVDTSAVWGGLETSMSGLKSQYNELKTDLSGDSPTVLKRYTSTIEQTARTISAKVSETAVGQKNLFVGSALRRQADGVSIGNANASGIECLGGVGGTNCFHAIVTYVNGAQQYVVVGNGVESSSQSIRIPKKGATYTFACWVKADSGMRVSGEAFYMATATDGNSQRKDRLCRVSPTLAAGEWQLLTMTAEIPANAAYDYVMVMFSATHTTAGATLNAWMCRPMVTEGDGWWGWCPSAQDYGYIGGNMLEWTDLLTVGGNLTIMNGTANGEYGGSTAVRCAASGSDVDLLKWKLDGKLPVGRDFILSFMAKGSGSVLCRMYGSGSGWKMLIESSDGVSERDATDGSRTIEVSGEWRRYWIHWRNYGTRVARYLLLRVPDGSDVTVAQPKLEEGATMTDWTACPTTYVDDRAIESRLYSTGIDIESGRVTVTGDNFVVRNNEGVETAMLDADGNLVAGTVTSVSEDINGNKMTTRIGNGQLTVTTTKSQAMISIGLDINGNPMMLFTDIYGSVVYRIGTDGPKNPREEKGQITVAEVLSAQMSVGEVLGNSTQWQVSVSIRLSVGNTSGAALVLKSDMMSVTCATTDGVRHKLQMSGGPYSMQNLAVVTVPFTGLFTVKRGSGLVSYPSSATWTAYGPAGEELATGSVTASKA